MCRSAPTRAKGVIIDRKCKESKKFNKFSETSKLCNYFKSFNKLDFTTLDFSLPLLT
jgi:hypothetical protein